MTNRDLVGRFLQLPFRLQFGICERAGLHLADFDDDDEAMAAELFRRAGRDHDLLVRLRLEMAEAEEGLKKALTCTVDPQQCDAECQARPERKCAAEKPVESVYDRAREALACAKENAGYLRDETSVEFDALSVALDAGEAAEKRAEEAEKRVEVLRNTEAACCPEDVGFPEYIRSLLRRAESAERERDELRERVEKLEKALEMALEIMRSPVVLPDGHSGDEETGQHDEDCARCLLGSAIERAEYVLSQRVPGPLDPPKEGCPC